LASGAEVVATACPACVLQLTDLLSKGGDSVRVKHVIELFAERLPGKYEKNVAGYRLLV